MSATKFLIIFGLLIMCDSTCFIEEQSTTPMRAYSIRYQVESYRKCQTYCQYDPKCVTATYSETKRICHLQVPTYYTSCGLVPYKRYVKTEANCIGTSHAAPFVRTNLILEHGLDPCFPDRSFLHPELVNLQNASAPPCPVRKLDGSEGPVLHFRALDGNGSYSSFGNSRDFRTYFSSPANTFNLLYNNDVPNTPAFPYWMISATCAEEGDECPCAPLPLHPTIVGTRPTPNVIGACPGQRLHTKPVRWTGDFVIDGSTARLFCAAGNWMAGENDPGNFMLIYSGVCAN